MGVSVTRYRNRVRVARALDRLEHGEDSLAALAADLGFADQAHLCRTVRQHLGARRQRFAACSAVSRAWPLARPGRFSELEELRVRRCDPLLAGAEIDEHGDLVLNADDHAEAVRVVAHPVLYGELFQGRGRARRHIEGTSGQETPGGGARRLHSHQCMRLSRR
jgi:Helix-turn-helix domain